jgi:hypothetical protein
VFLGEVAVRVAIETSIRCPHDEAVDRTARRLGPDLLSGDLDEVTRSQGVHDRAASTLGEAERVAELGDGDPPCTADEL